MSDRARELAVLDAHLASAGVTDQQTIEDARRAFEFDRLDRFGDMVAYAASRAVAAAVEMAELRAQEDEVSGA